MSTAFGKNLLPSDASKWTLSKASISSAGLTLQSGGSASIKFTSLDNTNILPNELRVEAKASNYGITVEGTGVSNARIFINVRIIFEDNNAFDARLPVTNIDDGFRAILHPNISNYAVGISAYNSVEFSIFSSVSTVISPLTFCRSLSDALTEDRNYYGIQISTENGLKIWREDGLAEAIFNGDTFSMRSKDDQGNMTDAIYFDAVERKYKLSGNVIVEGAIASDAVFTNSLYAERGDVSELTVDELTTSHYVLKYLAMDCTDDNFQHIHSIDGLPYNDWVSAATKRSCISSANSVRLTDGTTPLFWTDESMIDVTSSNTGYPAYVDRKQCTNAYGTQLYWAHNIYNADGTARLNNNGYPIDESGSQVYTTTDSTDWPVYIFDYTESVKQRSTFVFTVEGYYTPVTTYGAGDGNGGEYGELSKQTNGLSLTYKAPGGTTECGVYLHDDGFVDVTQRRASIVLDTAASKITISPEGSLAHTVDIAYAVSGDTLTLTWPDGKKFTVVKQ